jgi:hypothetical protein
MQDSQSINALPEISRNSSMPMPMRIKKKPTIKLRNKRIGLTVSPLIFIFVSCKNYFEPGHFPQWTGGTMSSTSTSSGGSQYES